MRMEHAKITPCVNGNTSRYTYLEGKLVGAKISQEEIMQLLDKLYEQSMHGVAKVSPPIDTLSSDYLQKNRDVDTAAKQFITYQIAKCTTSGFVTG